MNPGAADRFVWDRMSMADFVTYRQLDGRPLDPYIIQLLKKEREFKRTKTKTTKQKRKR